MMRAHDDLSSSFKESTVLWAIVDSFRCACLYAVPFDFKIRFLIQIFNTFLCEMLFLVFK